MAPRELAPDDLLDLDAGDFIAVEDDGTGRWQGLAVTHAGERGEDWWFGVEVDVIGPDATRYRVRADANRGEAIFEEDTREGWMTLTRHARIYAD